MLQNAFALTEDRVEILEEVKTFEVESLRSEKYRSVWKMTVS